MGNKSIIFLTLWITLGNVCATFSFDLETASDAEFGEFADEGTHAHFAIVINVDLHKQVGENFWVPVWGLRICITLESAQVHVSTRKLALSGGGAGLNCLFALRAKFKIRG